MSTPGRVLLAATPLGRPADASQLLRQLLAQVPVIAAEDTRRLQRLCSDLGITPTGRVVSFYDANETVRVPQLIEALRSGDDVLVVTDAGMPSVSDPGYRLVVAAVDAGIEVSAAPGPSAVITALAVSGLPVDRFCFEGFLPRKVSQRRRRVDELAREPRTMVFFEAPRRTAATLKDLADAFGGQRRAAVCRELTKTHEQVLRGPLAELLEWAEAGEVRGEVTLVVAGAPEASAEWGAGDLVAGVAVREDAGMSRKEAIADVARESKVPKREVFDAVVAAKRSSAGPEVDRK